jgi:hypothetical protein
MRKLALAAVWLLTGGCAAEQAEEKKPPPSNAPDEFRGFAALRGAPREKEKKEPEGDSGGGKKKEAEPAAETNQASSGKGPSKEAVLAVLAQGEKKLAVCLEHHGEVGVYQLQMAITPDGKVKEAKPVPTPTRKQEPDAYADIPAALDGGHAVTSPTSLCIAKLMARLTFPPYEGQTISFTYPILLKR